MVGTKPIRQPSPRMTASGGLRFALNYRGSDQLRFSPIADQTAPGLRTRAVPRARGPYPKKKRDAVSAMGGRPWSQSGRPSARPALRPRHVGEPLPAGSVIYQLDAARLHLVGDRIEKGRCRVVCARIGINIMSEKYTPAAVAVRETA